MKLRGVLPFAVVFLGAASGAFAQGTAAAPVVPGGPKRLAFDVTSVKRYDMGSHSAGGAPKGNAEDGLSERSNLEFFVMQAYRVNLVQLVGAPDWMQTEIWDIDAKSSGPVPWAEKQLMLQTLLADRFKLALHTETRMLPTYSLVVAKGGAKMQPTAPDTPQRAAVGQTLIRGAFAMSSLASALTGATGRLVTDKTGLSGLYTLDMRWTVEGGDNGSSLITALGDLGLKLESEKSPVQVYVVDHVERPSQN